jgi:hypothetical protein
LINILVNKECNYYIYIYLIVVIVIIENLSKNFTEFLKIINKNVNNLLFFGDADENSQVFLFIKANHYNNWIRNQRLSVDIIWILL